MHCVLINAIGNIELVPGIPDIFVADEDFDKVLLDQGLRISIYREVRDKKIVNADCILVAPLGKLNNGVYEDYSLRQLENVEYKDKKGFGVYEKL